MKTYEKNLPEGYKEVFVVDAADKKISVFFSVGSLVIMALVVGICFLFVDVKSLFKDFNLLIFYAVFLGGSAIYLICHELTHGIVYKALTKQKLTFGLKLTVAYCGVPDIYVYRKTAIASLVAPLIVFSIVLIGCLLTLTSIHPSAYFGLILLLGEHVGGCIGDMYDTWLLLTKLNDDALLMNDTGPKQTFYLNK